MALNRLRSLLAPPIRNDGETCGVNRGGESGVDRLSDAETRSEFSHELYIDSTNLIAALKDCSPVRSLEVGCGYGRLTPWIADRAEAHYAIDPERSLVRAARREHPHVSFQCARAEALPFPDEMFGLCVTWGVLNHVPGDSISIATEEIDRVVTADGTLVISEATAGRPDPRWTYRSIEEWHNLFASRQLVGYSFTERNQESFRNPEREHVVMKFR